MVQVYFATNRVADDPNNANNFGSAMAAYDRGAITYAVADVTVDITGSGDGTIDAISDHSMGQFSANAVDAIVAAGVNLLVFIHGFDNTFSDSLIRAALNAEWYRATGEPMANTVVLAFCWPSAGQAVNLNLGSADAVYKRDQLMATDTGYHLEFFLAEIDRIRQACQAQDPGRRAFLLAHSMGNWALQAAIARWYQAQQPADDLFDEAILAAADEQADTFAQPGGGRLDHLSDVARRITIYYSRNDAILWLSSTINRNARLGHDGPDNATDTGRFPISLFRMVDCSAVNDYAALEIENTHQYYRLSPTVRTDIVAVMAQTADPAGGIVALP